MSQLTNAWHHPYILCQLNTHTPQKPSACQLAMCFLFCNNFIPLPTCMYCILFVNLWMKQLFLQKTASRIVSSLQVLYPFSLSLTSLSPLSSSACFTSRIELGFSNMLQKLFWEMQYWERLRFEVPHYTAPVYSRCEQLRVMRENVLLIVRDYSNIIGSLRPSERSLFREWIRALDRKFHPGFTELTWASEGIQEFFVNDCSGK